MKLNGTALLTLLALAVGPAWAGDDSEPIEDPEVAPEILALKGDRAYGEYLASDCLTCHKADGSSDGMPSITGWPHDAFVTVMHSYKAKVRSHPVMQMMAGRLSNEEIAALAAFFAELE